MSINQDEIIQQIQIKHGVKLSQDDPILMLQTMLDSFSKKLEDKQATLLSDTQSHIDALLAKSEAKTKELAERLINIAVEEGQKQARQDIDALLLKIENKLLSADRETPYASGNNTISKYQMVNLFILVCLISGSTQLILRWIF